MEGKKKKSFVPSLCEIAWPIGHRPSAIRHHISYESMKEYKKPVWEYYFQFSKVSMKLLYNCADCQVIKESIIINLVAFLMSYYSIRCLRLSLKETTRQIKFSLFSYCIYVAQTPHNKRSDLQDKTHFLILGNHKVQLQISFLSLAIYEYSYY